jgi:hypothetical protein
VCDDRIVKLTFYVFVWSHPGMDDALIAYEDSVLALVSEYGGTVLQRARSNGAGDRPLEIQLYEWASQAAMDSYMSDPRRTALAPDRARAVVRTEIVPVQLV